MTREEALRNRNIVEAFRLGIVPSCSLEDWTFGRDKETEMIRKWLHDQTLGSLFVLGEYGSGKSHLLEFLSRHALHEGYATALVGLNPNESPPGFPKRVYRYLVHRFRFLLNGNERGFRDFLREASARGALREFEHHPFLGPVFREIAAGRETERMWRWIEGENIRLPGEECMHDYTTAANIYCNVLGCLGWIAGNILGLNGLLILLDEADLMDAHRYRYELMRGFNFLRGLCMVAIDEDMLLEERVVKNQARGVYCGERSGLVCSGHLPIPYIDRISSLLKVAIAVTPTRIADRLVAQSESWSLFLDPLHSGCLHELFERFVQTYEHLYAIELSPEERDIVFEGLIERCSHSTRLFIKSLVESLDFKRFHHHLPIETLFENETDFVFSGTEY